MCHPKRKQSYSNHPFSGAMLVSGRLWNLQNCQKILWINCLHLICFRPKSGNRTVFGTSFPKRPMVMRLFSWLQQEDTVVGSSPPKTCSRNNSIKKQMYFIGNSRKCAHLALNYSGCKVLQSHLGPAWSKKTLCSIYTMRRRSFQRNVFPTKTIWATRKTFYDIKTRLVESY